MSSDFGNILKKIRTKKRFTQQEVADAVGTTKGTVSKWENGSLEPNLTMLKLIASFLEVSIDELLDYNIYDYTFEYTHNNTKLIHKEKK